MDEEVSHRVNGWHAIATYAAMSSSTDGTHGIHIVKSNSNQSHLDHFNHACRPDVWPTHAMATPAPLLS